MKSLALYEDHAQRSNLAYLLAYEEWENSLTPELRTKLGSAASPDLEDHRAHNSKREVIGALADAAERSSASYSQDYATEIDSEEERIAELADIPLSKAKIICVYMQQRIEQEAAKRESKAIVTIAAAFLNATNSKLLAGGLAFASDLALTAGLGTMQDWARKIAVSRAAVSKVAKWWQRQLGLPTGSHMRDPEKCRAYSEAQKQKHWRKQKVVAGAALEAAAPMESNYE